MLSYASWFYSFNPARVPGPGVNAVTSDEDADVDQTDGKQGLNVRFDIGEETGEENSPR